MDPAVFGLTSKCLEFYVYAVAAETRQLSSDILDEILIPNFDQLVVLIVLR